MLELQNISLSLNGENGEGEGRGEKILNPRTIMEIEEGGSAELEMI
jgi:hypothetical protein